MMDGNKEEIGKSTQNSDLGEAKNFLGTEKDERLDISIYRAQIILVTTRKPHEQKSDNRKKSKKHRRSYGATTNLDGEKLFL